MYNLENKVPLERAIHSWASKCHERCGCIYGGYYPYHLHLDAVVRKVEQFAHLLEPPIPNDLLGVSIVSDPKPRLILAAAASCHDLLEDCHMTYGELKEKLTELIKETPLYEKVGEAEKTSESISNIVYEVTNHKGKSRQERNLHTWNEIRSPEATLVKLCDRLCNMTFSFYSSSSMWRKYLEEQKMFEEILRPISPPALLPVWNSLAKVCALKE